MTGSSISLGKVSGIPVRLHWTFLLLLIWVAVSQISIGGSLAAGVAGAVFLAAIFVCVVLHELGHCFAARYYGISTKHITLSPLGGVAALDATPRNWKEELWVSLAGPAVNVAICIALLPILVLNPPAPGELMMPSATLGAFAAKLFIGNMVMVIFNLLPAFPMDGGRVFRALLESRKDRLTATRIAARTGQGFAVFFALTGLSISLILVFIGIFIFLAAEGEYRMVESQERLKGIPASSVMRTRFEVIDSCDTISDALRKSAWYGQDSFPVVGGGRVTGMLDRSALQKAAMKNDLRVPVGNYAITDYAMATPGDDLAMIQDLIARTGQTALPVFEAGDLIGLIDQRAVASMFHAPVREIFTSRSPETEKASK
ncbi:MAG: site-2 protease family protein [Verrucomicrobiales bacterium]|nr:site-2 protease family protein [Verrucomicrobiales bacterium]